MSEIITDKLTGKTSAGDVTITSEGGSATMQLQQGVAKAWLRFNATSSNSINDSLNVSSVRDNSTGYHGVTLNSAMNDSNWSVQCTGTGASTSNGTIMLDSSSWGGNGTNPYRTTTQANFRGIDGSDLSTKDHADHNSAVFGDLA